MTWITPFRFNMDISLSINEGISDHPLIAKVQEIARDLIIPIAMIMIFEAVVKNLIFISLANLGIKILNTAHAAYIKTPKPIPVTR